MKSPSELPTGYGFKDWLIDGVTLFVAWLNLLDPQRRK